jgi:hypothetical protein
MRFFADIPQQSGRRATFPLCGMAAGPGLPEAFYAAWGDQITHPGGSELRRGWAVGRLMTPSKFFRELSL